MTDPSIWNHKRLDPPSLHSISRFSSADTLTFNDPTKVWIDFLLDHGGFLTLLGLPAVIAFFTFLIRMRWLRLHRTPHGYGRTNLIYWPSQFFIATACVILLILAVNLSSNTTGWNHGLFVGVILTLIAWITAIPLNRLEHRYESRSSDYLFTFYLISFLTSVATLYISSGYLGDQDDAGPVMLFNFIKYYTIALAIAFFFEAFPRQHTRVQRLAREKENLSDQQQANLFYQFSFAYYGRIISLGASRPLTGDDLINMDPPKLRTKPNYDLVAAFWEQAKTNAARKQKKPSFFWAVLRAYKKETAFMLLVRLVGFSMLYASPLLFGQLLRFIEDYSTAVQEGRAPPPLKIGLAITATMLLSNIELGIQARAATVAMIYRKALKLSPKARQSSTLGEITNHMAVDAEKWIEASTYLPLLISVPFELTIAIYLLYRLLGWSFVAGLAVFAILVPIQTKMAAFMNGFQDDQLKWMDSRLRLMTELFSNIKIVKLYHWEMPFRKKIDALRAKELKALKGLATIRSLLTIVFSSVTLLMALFTFWVYSTVGGPNMTPGKMTSEVVFVSIALFGIMNRPLGLVAHMISKAIAVNVAMKRIQKFLLMEEIDTTTVRRYSRQPPSSDGSQGQRDPALAIDIQNGTFAWEKPAESAIDDSARTTETYEGERQPLLANTARNLPTVRPTLSNITLQIAEGSLTAIVGRIGQGKSSLLAAVMGEMYKVALEGVVAVYGDIAYVPQQAWIINATVRDNILFGKPFDQEKYDRIIYAAGLQPDLKILAAGDMTEIGERGINLSGGQKQRVSLARAAYQDADIYLLDDPLSAVDAHVSQHLWQNLVGPEGLLRNKTRLLVTHGIHHLEHVDQIVLLKGGTISEKGEYQQLMKERGAFYQLIKDFSTQGKKKRKSNSTSNSKHSTLRELLLGKKDTNKNGDNTAATEESIASANSSISNVDIYSDSEGDASERNTIAEEPIASKAREDGIQETDDSGELIADEKMEVGRVSWKILSIYAQAASYRNAMFCIILFILAEGCHIGTNFWLRYWISDTEDREKQGQEPRPASYYLIGYGQLVALYMCLDVIVNYVTEVVCGIRASKILFDRLLTRVLRLPMSFFDVTPMGRIVNRFSSDIDAIDTQLPEEWNDLFAFMSIIGGTLFVIAYSTPIFLVAIPPLMMVYFGIQYYFIKSSSSLKRLNSVSKSPLYQHFSESLTGVSTIRVMRGLQERFIHQNEQREDVIVNRYYAYNLNNRWLQIRLESLGAITVYIAATLAVMNADKLDPSLVGLALSYALNMIGFINYLVRTVNEIQNILVSVERVDEYSQKPTEAPVETDVHLPPNWPAEGRVVFKDYSARYREGLDLVVKDVSFTVEPRESVGIVGRTGAGKSSLTLALFRIIEAADSYWARASDPSNDGSLPVDHQVYMNAGSGGSIEIDGVDISTLGLKDLRQHLSIIPQDPTLFAGTVRENLDPFEECTDKDLWEALERAHLKNYISSLAGGLSFEVAQNGENFSVGQRSLICLARALLRKTKVLVLDEATAAVDVETDDLIQKTIRMEFKDRTILTIAHRIKTVMDSDKILVLEKGRVQEYESPKELLKRKNSLFYQLAEQAGEVDTLHQ
ncbi:hypothetical protein BX616_007298 [Lobosporangium transversale]|nr:hypothetical protein BX616_007298 [Lobosporangium transversale]